MKQLHSRCLLEDSFNSAHNVTNFGNNNPVKGWVLVLLAIGL